MTKELGSGGFGGHRRTPYKASSTKAEWWYISLAPVYCIANSLISQRKKEQVIESEDALSNNDEEDGDLPKSDAEVAWSAEDAYSTPQTRQRGPPKRYKCRTGTAPTQANSTRQR